MLNILITGGAGYIGTKLLQQIDKKNARVDVLDNFNYGQYYLAGLISQHANEVYRYDIRQDKWLDLLPKYDVIIHLAALVGAPVCDQAGSSITYEVNQRAVEKLVSKLSSNQKIIFPNTNSLYGAATDEICTEETVGNPVSSYAITKQKAEEAILQHPNSTSLRLATVFGVSPRMRLDLMVNDFCYKAYFNNLIKIYEGHFRRNFVHIDNVCDIIECLVGMRTKQEVFNLGLDSANMTKLDLANKITNTIGGKVEIEEGEDKDKRDYFVSSQKIISRLAITDNFWKTLDDGILELRRFFDALPQSPYLRQSLMKYMRNV